MVPHVQKLMIDPRVGSSDLYPLMSARRVPCELFPLEFGDAALIGRGDEDRPVPVAIERKRVRDLLSSFTSGRFAGHQLPGLLRDYEHTWLVVEGVWRAGQGGVIEIPRAHGKWEPVSTGPKRFLMREIESFLLTLELRGGIRLRRTRDAEETADFLATLHHWWTSKTFSDHRSHLAMNDKSKFGQVEGELEGVSLVAGSKVSITRRLAAQLPGIGYKTSALVVKHFGTPLHMALADEQEWQKIDGIGKTTAQRIVRAITTGKENGG